MASLRFVALPTETVRALQAGAPDANGQVPERRVADGAGPPCRHCLAQVAQGEPYLVLAHRPFPSPQPYAEVGPIFLHAEPCARYAPETRVPPMFLARRALLIRGYGSDHRIVYGTGQIVPAAELAASAATLLARPQVAYVHARSDTNNCYQCRIELAGRAP
jgi:hypothetical protein